VTRSTGERLTLATCRQLLGVASIGLTDRDVERLRDQLYELAQSIVFAYEGRNGSAETQTELASISEIDREEVEERAAILEWDARMSRDAATRVALVPSRRRRRIQSQVEH
jgi:hypothetical protein